MEYRSFVKKSISNYDGDFEVTEVTQLGEDEVLVKVSAVGLCGSDLHMYAGHSAYDWIDFPLVLGHEVTGVITKVGSGQSESILNKRVVINPYIACGICEHCQNGFINRCEFDNFSKEKTPSEALQYGFRKSGGLAEYMKVKKDNVLFIDDAVDETVAAISEGLAVSYTGLLKVKDFKHKRILVVGPGPIGLGIVALLSGFNNKQIEMLGTEQDKERLRIAQEMGASNVYENWSEVQKQFNEPYDAIIDCSGHHSIPEESLKWLVRGGDIVLLGISSNKFSIPMDQIVRGEISVKGSYGITVSNYIEVLEFATDDSFPFDKVVSEVVPFNDIKSGFDKALDKAPGKIVIKI